MRSSVRTPSTVRPRRTRLATVTAVISGVLLAGCGGTSGNPTATPAASTPSSGRATASAGPPTTPLSGAGPVAFANCMRANGVPNFPDPNRRGNFDISTAAGVDPASPAFRAAQAKCQKYMGIPGGPGAPSFSSQTKAQSLTKLRRIAVCMRAHGISQFPDPSPTAPVHPAGSRVGVITDFDGAFLAFPPTLNLDAPAYRQALAACGAPPLGLPH